MSRDLKLISLFIRTIPLFLSLFLSAGSLSAQTVLVQGKDKAITTTDILADGQRIPPESRVTVFSDPSAVAQIAKNLYVRRIMSDLAVAAGMEKDQTIAAALQLAREKVLSDAWLARIDKENTPSRDVLEKMARSTYVAKPERFKQEEQVRVSHILIGENQPGGKEEAEKLLADLKAGADFETLAKKRSSDRASAEKGGELAFFGRNVMAAEFEAAAFMLEKPGQLSEVVRTKFGYHIIKFQERRAAGTRPFDEVRDQLIEEARSSVQQSARVNAAQRIDQEAILNPAGIKEFSTSQPLR
jgi:peptidyl-prolyl cis-trans isomerase C